MARPTTALEVRRTEWLTPRMVRVVAGGAVAGGAVAGGAGLAGFPDSPHTDRHVRILFPLPGVAYPEPFDMDSVRAVLPRARWPATRTYTVRALDRVAGELAIDVVHHGDAGLAGPWAAAVRPGEVFHVVGPEGSYAPDPGADWHLLVGDESALPAIAAACERVPPGAPAHAVLEVADAAEEQALSCPGDLTVTWLHRDGAAPGQLVDAMRSARLPAGRVHAFVHGEAGLVRDVRRHLVGERAMTRANLSVSGYWRLGESRPGAVR